MMYWNPVLLCWPLLTGTGQVFCQWKIYCDVVNFLSPLFHRTPDGRLWSCINLIVNAPQHFHGVNTLRYILRDQTLRNSKDQHHHPLPLNAVKQWGFSGNRINVSSDPGWQRREVFPVIHPVQLSAALRPQRPGPFWFNTSQTWTPGIY